MLPAPVTSPRPNRLLAALPAESVAALWIDLVPVRLGRQELLYAPHQPIPYVYFPLTGVCSLLTVLDNDTVVEVALVGHEGLVGIARFLGVAATPGRAIAQVPGEALRMEATVFEAAVARDAALRAVLGRYVQGLLTQIAQSAACNRAHPIEERCARWLLMTHDRVGGDRFPLTHQFLAQMLGVRRATVTVALGLLQRAGLIHYHRGLVTIVDRPGLEAAACECYRLVREEFARLLAMPTP